jgi:hypothetical protein
VSYEIWNKRLGTIDPRLRMAPALAPRPVPQPFPIRLDLPHLREVRDHLKIVRDGLIQVQQRPTSWRWVFVGLYKVLGHALALALQPAPPRPEGEGFGHLTALYREARRRWPHLPNSQEAVEEIEKIRTTYVTYPVREWPMGKEKLPVLLARAWLLLRSLPIADPAWADLVHAKGLLPESR